MDLLSGLMMSATCLCLTLALALRRRVQLLQLTTNWCHRGTMASPMAQLAKLMMMDSRRLFGAHRAGASEVNVEVTEADTEGGTVVMVDSGVVRGVGYLPKNLVLYF
jgi:hypothetical protein